MGGSSPCASCKLLRRRCAVDCIFAPYFPSDDPHKFAIVHKVFGASNVSKMLQELPVQQRSDAVSSLVYEANARARDPVYGCVGAISYLQSQVSQLQVDLAMAQAEILCIQMQQQQQQQQQSDNHHLAAALALQLEDEEDCKLFYGLQPAPATLSYLASGWSSSGSSQVTYYEGLKKESTNLYGHDVVS